MTLLLDFDVKFTGYAWPKATLEGKKEYVFVTKDGERLDSTVTVFNANKPRRKRVENGPAAYWRNFGEMRPDDDNAFLTFLRAKGDPDGRLSEVGTTDTFMLPLLIHRFRVVARLWAPIGADGTSRLTASETEIEQALTGLIDPEIRGIKWGLQGGFNAGRPHKSAPPTILEGSVRVDVTGQVLTTEVGTVAVTTQQNVSTNVSGQAATTSVGLVTTGDGHVRVQAVANRLRDYMFLSAAMNLAARAPMKRCVRCQDYFVLARSDAVFCSATCRSMTSAERRQQGD